MCSEEETKALDDPDSHRGLWVGNVSGLTAVWPVHHRVEGSTTVYSGAEDFYTLDMLDLHKQVRVLLLLLLLPPPPLLLLLLLPPPTSQPPTDFAPFCSKRNTLMPLMPVE